MLLASTAASPIGCVCSLWLLNCCLPCRARHTHQQTGRFIPEKSNIWRDCCDGFYDWVREHILEVRSYSCVRVLAIQTGLVDGWVGLRTCTGQAERLTPHVSACQNVCVRAHRGAR